MNQAVETERFHLIEWIVLIDEIHLNALMQLNGEELEKRLVEKLKISINCFFTLFYLCKSVKLSRITQKEK
ncbi:hypothetical protein [Bacillus sp. AY2-1]|uniref:hypothetical protein n=1 Tax=Bacillus sp. AY2-1 TaxID=2217828 RepID=UPI0011EFF446|nr:hypothetical protein [Bacillus sp. AY2-1]KAA0816442.1 hypothetical protein DN403_25180 [Bacillus sp. AY2-1]